MTSPRPIIIKRGHFLRVIIDGEERLGLAEMVAKSHPSECVFCGEPRRSKTGKPDLTCGDEEICRASYNTYWRRDQRAAYFWAIQQKERTTRYSRSTTSTERVREWRKKRKQR